VGAHLHGRSGQLAAAHGPLLAGDLVRRLPETLARLHEWTEGGLRDSEP
jgi:NAD(P)H-hydrate repair Nnr-like enzyme with NAD(P)H-hydrate dehydratase domain